MEKAIEYLSEKDKIFKQIIDKYGVPVIPHRPQGFETLVLLILEQQVSINSAKATYIKLKAKISNIAPEPLLNLDDEMYRNCGVSRQKTKYIKCLAMAVLNNEVDLNSFRTKTPEDVRAELITIKGIGNWTIDVYLMFALQMPDILPLGDIAIINTINELLKIDDKLAIENYTQKWAPYRSMASFLLWHYYLQKRNRKISYELP